MKEAARRGSPTCSCRPRRRAEVQAGARATTSPRWGPARSSTPTSTIDLNLADLTTWAAIVRRRTALAERPLPDELPSAQVGSSCRGAAALPMAIRHGPARRRSQKAPRHRGTCQASARRVKALAIPFGTASATAATPTSTLLSLWFVRRLLRGQGARRSPSTRSRRAPRWSSSTPLHRAMDPEVIAWGTASNNRCLNAAVQSHPHPISAFESAKNDKVGVAGQPAEMPPSSDPRPHAKGPCPTARRRRALVRRRLELLGRP
jgi:hypothetical protein